MENQKKNNKTYAFIGLGVLGAIVLTLGITYAYWRLTREQTNENVVTTACLDVDIESQQDDINLPKAYPISDEDGANLVPFKFTIHNKCEDIARYQINLESMSKNGELEIPEDERLNPKYLKYKINEVGKNGKIGLLTGEKNNDTTRVATTITDAYDAHILTTGYLKEGASKSYEFRIWMDGETTAEEIDSMNKTLVSKISIISTYATKALETLEDTILGLDIQEEDSGATGLYQVEHTGANIDYTTKAEKIKELQKTEYRFAGKDPNNYVSFGETSPEDRYELILCLNGYCDNLNIVPDFGVEDYYTSKESCETKKSDGELKKQIEEIASGQEYTLDCQLKVKKGEPMNLWRVIGLVNTPEGQKVKIIKNEIIGKYSWDTSSSEVNVGYGVNEWSKSDLMKLLNPNFDKENVNNSLYWNGTSGYCYVSTDERMEPCDFTGKGIPEELKEMIEEVTWNTGANVDEALKNNSIGNHYYDISTSKMYEYERSKNNGKQLCESNVEKDYYCNDEVERTISWSGKVGLMYPSDYGYATSGGSVNSRSQCLNQNLYFWANFEPDWFPEEIDHPDCYGNDWLKSTDVDFTISPASFSRAASEVFVVNRDGNVRYDGIDATLAGYVRPSVYLKADVMVVDGNGSKDSPWVLFVE